MRGEYRPRIRKRSSAPHDSSEAPPFTFVRKTLIVVGITAAAALALLIIGAAANVFVLIFAGILVAVLLRSLSNVLSAHTPLSEGVAFAIVLFLLVGLIGLGSWLLAPNIAGQIDQLIQRIPTLIDQLGQRFGQYKWGRRILAQMSSAARLLGVISGVAGFFSTTFGLIANIVIVLFIGVYTAVNPGIYKTGLARLFPPARRKRVLEVLDEIGYTLQWWLISRLIAMIVISLLTWVGLWYIGIQPALALGLLAGLLNFIPYLGPFLSAVPSLIIALGEGAMTLLYVDPPALTVSMQLLLGVLVGPLGVTFASPLTASAIVIIKMLYLEDLLGEKVKEV